MKHALSNEDILRRWYVVYAIVMATSFLLLLGFDELLLAGFALFHFLYAVHRARPGYLWRVLRAAYGAQF